MCIICKNGVLDSKGPAQRSWVASGDTGKYKTITNMKKLDCSGCTSLTTIPNIVGLKVIYCHGCTSLTSIPNIVGLKKLYCVQCTSLTSIPNIVGLKQLYCWGCPWLNHPHNPDFGKNVQVLRQLQKRLHNNLLSKKILKYLESEQFNNWYYSPTGPGGKMTIKRLEENKVLK